MGENPLYLFLVCIVCLPIKVSFFNSISLGFHLSVTRGIYHFGGTSYACLMNFLQNVQVMRACTDKESLLGLYAGLFSFCKSFLDILIDSSSLACFINSA